MFNPATAEFQVRQDKSKEKNTQENKSPRRFPEEPNKWYIHNHWPRQEIVDVYLSREISDTPIRQFQQELQVHQGVDESQHWLYPPRCVGQWCFPCDRPRGRRLQGTYRRRWRYCDDISFQQLTAVTRIQATYKARKMKASFALLRLQLRPAGIAK